MQIVSSAKIAKWLPGAKKVWTQSNYSPGLGIKFFSITLFQLTFCSMCKKNVETGKNIFWGKCV